MHIALYQPDIPQNLGAMMRLCACLDLDLDIIMPCGFIWDERKIRQSAMDYADHIRMRRHDDWMAFKNDFSGRRIILMTVRASIPYTDFAFRADDILLAGRESAGVPEDIHEAADARIAVKLAPGLRSLNIVTATAMIAGEALRQTRWRTDL